MNSSTEQRYYQAGQLLASLQGKRRLSDMESALIRELAQSSPAFSNSLKLLKILDSLGELLTISEIADRLNLSKDSRGRSETATIIIRLLRESGLAFRAEGGGGTFLSIGYSIPKNSILSSIGNYV